MFYIIVVSFNFKIWCIYGMYVNEVILKEKEKSKTNINIVISEQKQTLSQVSIPGDYFIFFHPENNY